MKSLTPTEQERLLASLGFQEGHTYAVEPDDSIEELEGKGEQRNLAACQKWNRLAGAATDGQLVRAGARLNAAGPQSTLPF